MKKETNTLPDKLSDLILLALADLELAEQSSDVHIDMSNWRKQCSTFSPYVCSVCFAGVVIIGSLKFSKRGSGIPESISNRTTQKLLALDAVRTGNVESALVHMNVFCANQYQRSIYRHVIPLYWKGSTQFKSALKILVTDLQTEGL